MGQFILGQSSNVLNRNKKCRLPTVAEVYPEIINSDKEDQREPTCNAAHALTRQEPFINQNLAFESLAMLTQLLRWLRYRGRWFCNLTTGGVVPLTIGRHGRNRSIANCG